MSEKELAEGETVVLARCPESWNESHFDEHFRGMEVRIRQFGKAVVSPEGTEKNYAEVERPNGRTLDIPIDCLEPLSNGESN